jgi:ribose-phosphate pyrophosphokinase
MKLFAGTSHPNLAEEVSKLSGIPLAKAEVIHFQNSECKVTIQEDVHDEVCYVIQTTSNPTDANYMELFFYSDALKRSGARKVIAVIPYFGYARQNIQHRPGECISLHIMIRFLESVGFDAIYTFDLHDEASAGVFSVPFKNLSAIPLMGEKIKEYIGSEFSRDGVVVVSPDQGGIERARELGEYFFGDDNFDSATVNKKRDEDHAHQSAALVLYGDVKGKTAIIVDDVATSGRTIMHAAKLCLENGAKRVLVAVTHHDLSPGVADELQNSSLEKFFSSNTLPMKSEYKFEKLEVISIASVITELLSQNR